MFVTASREHSDGIIQIAMRIRDKLKEERKQREQSWMIGWFYDNI